MRPKLREELSAAAERAGRSMSEEVEHRLEKSLADEYAQRWAFGSPETEQAVRFWAAMVQFLELIARSKWTRDATTRARCVGAMRRILDDLAGPLGNSEVAEDLPPDNNEHVGANIAHHWLVHAKDDTRPDAERLADLENEVTRILNGIDAKSRWSYLNEKQFDASMGARLGKAVTAAAGHDRDQKLRREPNDVQPKHIEDELVR
jgi:hypothetical protein